MNRPPLLMHLRLQGQQHRFGLWLPLFLLLPILLAIAIILTPLVLIAAIVTWPFGRGKQILLAGPAVAGCVCALRGLEVDVQQGRQLILISFR